MAVSLSVRIRWTRKWKYSCRTLGKELTRVTIRAMLPLGIALGISPYMLIALFPAVNGYFFIPNYPTVVAAINFDRTGTTHIGKYVLNHSFMMPGKGRLAYKERFRGRFLTATWHGWLLPG